MKKLPWSPQHSSHLAMPSSVWSHSPRDFLLHFCPLLSVSTLCPSFLSLHLQHIDQASIWAPFHPGLPPFPFNHIPSLAFNSTSSLYLTWKFPLSFILLSPIVSWIFLPRYLSHFKLYVTPKRTILFSLSYHVKWHHHPSSCSKTINLDVIPKSSIFLILHIQSMT